MQAGRQTCLHTTHINWLSSFIPGVLSDRVCQGRWVMMRQLANGLMGNEGPGAGSQWLDAELNSVYCVLTMLCTFNMLFSKCDNVNIGKPGTSNKYHLSLVYQNYKYLNIVVIYFTQLVFFAAYRARVMPIASYSKLDPSNKLQYLRLCGWKVIAVAGLQLRRCKLYSQYTSRIPGLPYFLHSRSHK